MKIKLYIPFRKSCHLVILPMFSVAWTLPAALNSPLLPPTATAFNNAANQTTTKRKNTRPPDLTDSRVCVYEIAVGYLSYNRSRTIISAYPRRFCPFHLSISDLSLSFIDKPIPHIVSLTAHSAKIEFPVALSCSFKSSF